MTAEEKIEIAARFYALNSGGNLDAAEELLTEDFFITIPPHLPFGGVYRGRSAFRALIPLVVGSVGMARVNFVATTAGGDYAIEIVEWVLADESGSIVQGTEVIRFRGNQICEIRPYYFDAAPMVAAAAARRAEAGPGS